jgi:uncharacterized membrane protein
MTETHAPAVHFATSLVPYRSLSRTGFKWLIRVAVLANLAIGLPMLVFGAWPVLGFMGLDVLLLWLLFKRSYLDARRSETLVLTDQDLVVQRVAPDGGREQVRLDAYWLRVDWDDEAERLTVTSRGNRVVIGRFLDPASRLEVADQLKAAIAAMRAPRYDHKWE